jgi:phosphatidylethanolamine/phosphatidyl-N-methylethanolamine N-methyltransferase
MFDFLKEVIRANRTTGAIAPSSRRLAEAVTDMAEITNADIIVEYGPGTGVFTEAILRKKKPDAFFTAMEVNEHFVHATKARFPEAHVVHDSAENTISYLKEAGYDHCDAIVSGLPWTRFDDELQDRILNATWEVLRPGGRFVTFGYSFSPLFPQGRKFFKGKLAVKFPKTTKSPPIWKNFPPCSVYIAEKEAEPASDREQA